jgi:IS5 family transposase
MDRVVPCAAILRTHLQQQWHAWGDPTMEDTLDEIESVRQFAGREFNEACDPGLDDDSQVRAVSGTPRPGAHMREGTIIDWHDNQRPSSTKSRDKTRDPDMH